MALRYELRPFPLHKVAEDTVVVFFLLVCFVSLSQSLVILARSAACFPDGALMLLLTEEKVLSRAPLTSLRRWEKKKGPCKTVSQLQETLINAAGKQLLRHPESVIDPPSVTTNRDVNNSQS